MSIESLYPVQRVIYKLIQGIPLDDKEKFELRIFKPGSNGDFAWEYMSVTEVQYAERLKLEGRLTIGKGEIKHVCLVAGRRSGKTHLLNLIMQAEIQKNLNSQLDNPLSFMLIGTDRDQCGLFLNALRDELSPTLLQRKANDTQDHISFQTDRDITETGAWIGSQRRARASLQALSRTFTKGWRCHHNGFVAIDEVDAINQNQLALDWDTLYKYTKGLSIVCGTPTLLNGSWFSKHFKKCRAESEGVLTISVPTWEMNPNIPDRVFVDARKKDIKQFWQDWGAYFLEQVTVIRPVNTLPNEEKVVGVSDYKPPQVIMRKSSSVEDLVQEMNNALNNVKDLHDQIIDLYKSRILESRGFVNEHYCDLPLQGYPVGELCPISGRGLPRSQ